MSSERSFHPASEMFPLMSDTDLTALASDIEANGLYEAIVLHMDGSILDGRNRHLACLKVGVESRFVKWDGQGTVEAFVLSMNLYRRHLTTSQRSMAAGRLANTEHGGDRRTDQDANLRFDAEVSIKRAAEQLRVSTRSVDNAKTVLGSDDKELIHSVEAGDMSVSNAAKKVRERDKQIDDLAPKSRKRKSVSPDARAARAETMRQHGLLAHQLYDGLDAITGLPDIETMVNATSRRRDVLATKVPIAISWLNDFEQALSERIKGNGEQSSKVEQLQGTGHEEKARLQDRDDVAGDGDQAA